MRSWLRPLSSPLNDALNPPGLTGVVSWERDVGLEPVGECVCVYVCVCV